MWKKNMWKAVQPQPTAVREKLVTKKKQKQMPKGSPACVTPLVRSTFEAIFAEQMATEKAAEKDSEGREGEKRNSKQN